MPLSCDAGPPQRGGAQCQAMAEFHQKREAAREAAQQVARKKAQEAAANPQPRKNPRKPPRLGDRAFALLRPL